MKNVFAEFRQAAWAAEGKKGGKCFYCEVSFSLLFSLFLVRFRNGHYKR